MPKLIIPQGQTSKILSIFIQDSSASNGDGLTGLLFDASGLTVFYKREGDASPTEIVLVSATVGSFTSSGFIEVDDVEMPGEYELHVPNAVLAAGVGSVTIMLKGATNMAVLPLEIQLDTVGAELAVIDSNVDDIKISTDTLPADPASESNVSAVGAAVVVVDGKVDTLLTNVAKILSFNGQNKTLFQPLYDANNNLTSATHRLYDTPANAATDNGVLGLLGKFLQTATYDLSNNRMLTFNVVEI